MTTRHESLLHLRHAIEVQREDARHQAEHWLDLTAELEETLDRYVHFFQDAPVGYVTLDDKGTIVNLNREAATLMNLPNPMSARWKPFLTYVFRPDIKIFLRHLLHCARRRTVTELRLGRGNDGPHHVRLISQPRSALHARHNYILTVVVNVDYEWRRERELRRSEKQHREIVEAANEGICLTNESEEIIFVNPRLGAMLGVPSESLIGRRIAEIVSAGNRAAKASALDDRGKDSRTTDQRLRRGDGTMLHVLASETVLCDDRGRFTGSLRMYTDATARQQLFEARELLVRQLVAAQESERQRIARELHDQLGQHIVGLSLGLARLASAVGSDAQSVALIEQLKRATDTLGRDMHTLAHELRPSALDHLGLVAALRGYGESLGTRTKLQIDMHLDDIDDLALASSAQTGIYRIAQEALTNVVKHANARSVSVILERRAGALQLIVEDDGRGFDQARSTLKLGLTGMRERAALLGGAVTVESSPGGGTTIYARIPLSVFEGNGNAQETPVVTSR